MQLGSRLRRNRTFYNKPKEPKPGKVKFQYDTLGTASNRAQYYINYSSDDEEERKDDYYSDDERDSPMNDRTSISLKEVNDLISKNGLKEEDVYFTAAFDEDYLVLEVVHVHKMSEQEKTQEYEEDLLEWEEQQKQYQEYEKRHIKQEIENLKRRAEELEKKKKK